MVKVGFLSTLIMNRVIYRYKKKREKGSLAKAEFLSTLIMNIVIYRYKKRRKGVIGQCGVQCGAGLFGALGCEGKVLQVQHLQNEENRVISDATSEFHSSDVEVGRVPLHGAAALDIII